MIGSCQLLVDFYDFDDEEGEPITQHLGPCPMWFQGLGFIRLLVGFRV